jgi:hypothetical protein
MKISKYSLPLIRSEFSWVLVEPLTPLAWS